MKIMRKILKYTIIGSVIVLLFTACSSEKSDNGNGDKKNEQNLYTLNKVREAIPETMKKAYAGEYKNLTFASFSPTVTKEDYVAEMRQERTEYGDESKTIEESINEQYDFMCDRAGRKIDKATVTDYKSGEKLDKVEQMLKEGNYPTDAGMEMGYGKPRLYYEDDTMKIETDAAWCFYEVTDKQTLRKKVNASDGYKVIKEYNAYNENKSLDDKYLLDDGECSIREAIKYAEKYQNELRGFPCGKDFRIEAEKVRVCEHKDGTYGFDVLMHRVYKGVPFVGLYQGSSVTDTSLDYDMGVFYMTGRQNVAQIMDLGANEIMTEEGAKHSKIISLDRVFTLVNERIGNNVKGNVISAKLAYQLENQNEELTELGQVITWRVIPVWFVELQNETDDRITQIYVAVDDYKGNHIRMNTVH